MEKLRELLNEFDPYIAKDWEHRDNLWYGVICWESAVYWQENWIQKIISKEYGFIKWLVENDKIDLQQLERKLLKIWIYKNIWYYEWPLMLLSIQDDPIEFLISILK